MNSARRPYSRLQPRRTRLAQLGFTLVELMLVIVIVGLLTATARELLHQLQPQHPLRWQ